MLRVLRDAFTGALADGTTMPLTPQEALSRVHTAVSQDVKLSTIGAAAWSPLGWSWSPLTAQGLSPGVQKFIPLGAKGHIPADQRALPHSPHKAAQDKSPPDESGSDLIHHLGPGGCERSSCHRCLLVHGTRGPGPLRGRGGSHTARVHLVLNDFRGLLFQKKNVSNLTDFCEPQKYHVFLT